MADLTRGDKPSPTGYADLVRVVLVREGVTYEVELGPGSTVELNMEFDSREVPTTTLWRQEELTGYATVKLEAHGKLVKSDRRPALLLRDEAQVMRDIEHLSAFNVKILGFFRRMVRNGG